MKIQDYHPPQCHPRRNKALLGGYQQTWKANNIPLTRVALWIPMVSLNETALQAPSQRCRYWTGCQLYTPSFIHVSQSLMFQVRLPWKKTRHECPPENGCLIPILFIRGSQISKPPTPIQQLAISWIQAFGEQALLAEVEHVCCYILCLGRTHTNNPGRHRKAEIHVTIGWMGRLLYGSWFFMVDVGIQIVL